MWICECGFKNSNSNQSCHGNKCKKIRPPNLDLVMQKREQRLDKRMEGVSKQFGEEQMMRKFKRMFGSMK